MTEQQIATLSLAAARGGHIFTPLDANYGAVGDGTDEAAKIQACVDEAMASPGNTVVLNPPVTFGIGSVIDFDGTYPVDVIGGTRHFSSSAFTLTKTANTVALRVPATAPRVYFDGISVKGLGGANPDTTPDGKPAMLIHARCRAENMFFYRCGGLAGLGETGTSGLVIGVIQLAALDNCNALDLFNLSFQDCSGDGLFVQNVSGSNVNTNAIQATIFRYYGGTGWAYNAPSGMRNTIRVYRYDKAGMASPGVFKIGYVENECSVVYAEGGSPLLVEFLSPGGRRNTIRARTFSEFTTICADRFNNTILQDEPGDNYLGDGSASTSLRYIGGDGVTFDAVKLPNPAASGFVTVKEAAYADIGTSLDIVSSAVQGTVTWSSRFARCAKVGCLVQLYVTLTGSVNVASANDARLNVVTGDMTFENGGNLGGPACNLRLTNSAVTAKPVSLTWKSTTQLQIVDALTGANMTFNDVVGANTFTLEGAITLLDRQGMA